MPLPARRALVAATALASALALGAPPAPAATAARPTSAGCIDTTVALPYEEAFLEQPQARRFVVEGGFEDLRSGFTDNLCRAGSAKAAERLVQTSAQRLWRTAVQRAQGQVQMGTLDRSDDRPLYWTRLAMVAALRQWEPRFELTETQRTDLIARLDRVSRGQEDIRLQGRPGTKRVVLTGFDPFTLDRDIRQGNPSGATALALDGTVVQTPAGPARIETALFPVRWRDFEQGMVERTLLPTYVGRDRIDLFATTSQGRPGRFDLEQTNGAWRAGFGDNEGVCYRGRVPIRAGIPTVTPQPQWTSATLPMAQMAAGSTGPFPVAHNTQVTEVDASTPDGPVTTACPAAPSPGTVRPDGPTPGSKARAGGGGNYLSNEIAYRATLLRDAVRPSLPGGHIHTPVLDGLPQDRDVLSAPGFERNRAQIIGQTRALLVRAVAATSGER
ncbi:hypothetical protein FB554_0310 [Barrientosiimonas humi]|uniref:Pyrrolidone-carboxylate peptidase n=1 Tax=Barrientosiimonas humi TaxID=999931 RepID=A0A542X8N2_9MICO|nr:pyroglutamyl peptidase [Barrientosiimonas humi]TQL32191.1 hypothetical protein FB554_0310 [Barrientosiimonas humi]CAG7572179.1 hypothetical protein BH39T_PBIAJDOK_00792 [Barrientosiimonas humi]